MAKDSNKRKRVELAVKRIPLRKLLHGKDIRSAAKALEDFRLVFNEQEILFGATLTIKMESHGEAVLYAHRPETDKEYSERMEQLRLAAERKAERDHKRTLMEAARLKQLAQDKKKNALETILKIAKENGLSTDEFSTLLNKN